MSCISPININNNVNKKCDLKCNYSFNYPVTNIIANNNGSYIQFTTKGEQFSPVKFNGEKYNVVEIRLYLNSLHKYGGYNVDAELQINHNSVNGTSNLMVCVPIIKGGSNSLLDNLIQEVSKKAPKKGGKTQINLSTFSLNNIIPKKEYYSYNGSHPDNCSTPFDYVVFKKENAYNISTSNYKILQSIISKSNYNVKTPKDGIFLNKNGPGLFNNLGDDIYIDCTPTGYDGSTLVTTPKEVEYGSFKLGFDFNIMEIFENDIFKIIIGVIIMIILYYITQTLFKKRLFSINVNNVYT